MCRVSSLRTASRAGALVLGLLVLGGGLATPAGAQVRLGGWTGVGEFGFSFQHQSQDAGVRQGTLFDRLYFEERLGVRNTLTIADPKFLSINFGLNLRLMQSRLEVNGGQKDSGDGRVVGFDLMATAFALKPFGFTLSASQVETVTPVEFAGSRQLEVSSLGLMMGLGGRMFPGTLRLRKSRVESNSDLNTFFRGIDQTRQSLTYTGSKRWQRHELSTFLEYQEERDRVAKDFSSEIFTVSANHSIQLLVPDLATLKTSIRYFSRGGALEQSSFNINQELRMRHRESLTSGLRYEFRDIDDFLGRQTEFWRGSVWLRHTLWESLETDFRVSKEQVSSGTDRTGVDEARLETIYRKNLPGHGKLQTSVRLSYQETDRALSEGDELLLQETHTARFGVPSVLRRPQVIPGSVVVTDALDATIYEEDVDYEIRTIGDITELLPLPGGRITEGQAILVHYRAQVPVDQELSTFTNTIRLSVDYGWVMPFVSYRSVDRRELGDLGQSLYENQDERSVGVRFQRRGPSLDIISFNEWRSRKSDLVAFDSLRLAANAIYRPASRWRMGLNLVHILTDFNVVPRDVQIDDVRADLRWRPLYSLTIRGYASNRETRDSAAPDQTFRRLGMETRWNLGKLSIIASMEGWERSRNGDRLDGFSGALRISRRFFPGTLVAPRRRKPPEPWPSDLPGMETIDYPAGKWNPPPEEEETEEEKVPPTGS